MQIAIAVNNETLHNPTRYNARAVEMLSPSRSR
jgi:hypothetical protein